MEEKKPIVQIRDVSKRFGAVTAVDNVSLEIRQNEFFALLGPSGCGKTTLLRMIAGFEIPSDGQILLDGQDVTGVPPNHRPVNMVFQSYAVFPHMTVFDNVAYGLKVTGTDSKEIKSRVDEALEMVQLEGFAGRQPNQLSGGQRQRVALARALVKRPKVLLLDEPLSALDAKLREAMQLELVRLQHSVGITFIIVTHDQNEALSMANRIAVMNGGVVRQIASPSELYEYPSERFVADFIGKINLFGGKLVSVGPGGAELDLEGFGKVTMSPELLAKQAKQKAKVGQDIGLAIRPEKVELFRDQPPSSLAAYRGKVTEVAYYGDTSHVFLAIDSGVTLSATVQNRSRDQGRSYALGEELWCGWQPEDVLMLLE
jgi:spermidine/putrescine ABC transporter ATP-binding subunit